MFSARSTIRTGSPISSTNSWPKPPMPPDWTTGSASGVVMKNRVISGWVTVTGPPRSICRRKIEITLPDEPRTLPKRTATNRVGMSSRAVPVHDPLAQHLALAVDRLRVQALSVEISTNRFAPNSAATSAITCVASTLFPTDSMGFASIIGTCLYAAAWNTTPGVYRSNTCRIFVRLPRVGDRERRREVAFADELALDLQQRQFRWSTRSGAPRRGGRFGGTTRADRAARAGDEHGLALE